MARKRRGSKSDSVRPDELSFLSSNPRLSRPLTLVIPPAASWPEIEDRRLWHPEGQDAPARTFSGAGSRLKVSPQSRVKRARAGRPMKSGRFLPFGLSFENPKSVLTCVRRKMRKEVLHALKLTRKGSGGKKRRSWRSNIRC